MEKELVLNEELKTQWDELELGFLIWIPIINQKTNEVDYGILYNTNNRLEESEKPVLKAASKYYPIATRHCQRVCQLILIHLKIIQKRLYI